MGPKRVYRIYKEEGLEVRTRKRRKYASAVRVPLPEADKPGERWSMDFVAARLADGKRLRVLTVIDHFDRSCPVLYADNSIDAGKVADALDRAAQKVGGLPDAITVDNGPEFAGNVLDAWAYSRGVKPDFISTESCINHNKEPSRVSKTNSASGPVNGRRSIFRFV